MKMLPVIMRAAWGAASHTQLEKAARVLRDDGTEEQAAKAARDKERLHDQPAQESAKPLTRPSTQRFLSADGPLHGQRRKAQVARAMSPV